MNKYNRQTKVLNLFSRRRLSGLEPETNGSKPLMIPFHHSLEKIEVISLSRLKYLSL